MSETVTSFIFNISIDTHINRAIQQLAVFYGSFLLLSNVVMGVNHSTKKFITIFFKGRKILRNNLSYSIGLNNQPHLYQLNFIHFILLTEDTQNLHSRNSFV